MRRVPGTLQGCSLDRPLLLGDLSSARPEADGVSERWLDRKRLAEHYSCSVRSIEEAIDDGMPGAIISGRKKFQVSAVEPWLETNGYLRRDVTGTTVPSNESGAALREQPAPGAKGV
jgi:hypothetical protein